MFTHLYGLKVYITYIHICIHGEIRVNNLYSSSIGHSPFNKTFRQSIRLIRKSCKSTAIHQFISQHINEIPSGCVFRDIGRAQQEL